MNIDNYWKSVLKQDAEDMKTFFHKDAYINWNNTNEHFTVDEFIQANCEYPGQWDGKIKRKEEINDLLITVVHVFSLEQKLSFHVTSFIKVKEDKILSIDEYWGDDGEAPKWRTDKHIGTPIQNLKIFFE